MRTALLVLLTFGVVYSATAVDWDTIKNKKASFGLEKETKPDCAKISDGLGCACPVCKNVVEFTKMMIIDHVPTEEQVLDKVCHRIFGRDKSKRDFCIDIVKLELPDIVKYVRERTDPKKCCIKFC